MKILVATRQEPLAALIQNTFRRFRYEWEVVNTGVDVIEQVKASSYDLVIIESVLTDQKAVDVLEQLHSRSENHIPPFLVLIHSDIERKAIEKKQFHKVEITSRPIALREFVTRVQNLLHLNNHLACLGGGTGLYTLLSGLKALPSTRLTSIVSMSDDGGSTGRLRDIFNVLPPGDLRRSLVALSTAPDVLNELIQYRFDKGDGLKGHNLGNLLLTALSEKYGSMSKAVRLFGEMINLQGDVIPVTESVNTLKAELENGSIIEGEHRINMFEGIDPKLKITRLWQEPQPQPNEDAIRAILQADWIVIGPGDLYTSVISNLIVPNIAEAIVKTKAKKMYVCNVMTKPGETTDYKASDHVREIVKYLKDDCLDYIICSTTSFSPEIVVDYAKKGQAPVLVDSKEISNFSAARVVAVDVASTKEMARHDSLKLSTAIRHICATNQVVSSS